MSEVSSLFNDDISDQTIHSHTLFSTFPFIIPFIPRSLIETFHTLFLTYNNLTYIKSNFYTFKMHYPTLVSTALVAFLATGNAAPTEKLDERQAGGLLGGAGSTLNGG